MANEIVGRDIELGVAIGDEAIAPQHSIKKVTANLMQEVEHAEDDTVRGSVISGQGRRKVTERMSGTIDSILHADAAGYFLTNIYGSVSSAETDTGTGAYEHTFTLNDDIDHTPLTFYLKEGADEYESAGVHIDSFEVTAAIDDYVRFSSEVIGKDLDETGTFTPSYQQESDFIGKDVTIKVAASKAGLTSANAIEAKEVTITQNRNLGDDYTFDGNYTPSKIFGPTFETEISLTKNREIGDDTFKDLYEGDDWKYMRVTIEGDADISDDSSDVNPKLEYTFYKVQVTDWSKTDDADELSEEEVTLMAYMNEEGGTDDGKVGNATLVNNTADYIEVTS